MYDMIMCMCVLFLNNGQIKTNSSSSSSSMYSQNNKISGHVDKKATHVRICRKLYLCFTL